MRFLTLLGFLPGAGSKNLIEVEGDGLLLKLEIKNFFQLVASKILDSVVGTPVVGSFFNVTVFFFTKKKTKMGVLLWNG